MGNTLGCFGEVWRPQAKSKVPPHRPQLQPRLKPHTYRVGTIEIVDDMATYGRQKVTMLPYEGCASFEVDNAYWDKNLDEYIITRSFYKAHKTMLEKHRLTPVAPGVVTDDTRRDIKLSTDAFRMRCNLSVDNASKKVILRLTDGTLEGDAQLLVSKAIRSAHTGRSVQPVGVRGSEGDAKADQELHDKKTAQNKAIREQTKKDEIERRVEEKNAKIAGKDGTL